MSTPETEQAAIDVADPATSVTRRSTLTWRGHTEPRMESVRVQLLGKRIKAYGRIVAAATDDHPAFSASYDLVTDDSGATRRLSLTTTLAERERQISIAHDSEGMWMVHDSQGTSRRDAFGGALHVDVMLSPFFNSLPIRQHLLESDQQEITVPLVYVRLPELAVSGEVITYRRDGASLDVTSPVASARINVDADGFVLDYPGLAERI